MNMDSVVERILWGRGNGYAKILESVVDVVLSDVKKSLQCNICPFCGKVFRNRRSLRTHIVHKEECNDLYRSSIRYAMDMYIYFRRYILRLYTAKRNYIVIDLPGRSRLRFRNRSELAQWIKSHRDEVMSLLKV